jgi:hypothetical protein
MSDLVGFQTLVINIGATEPGCPVPLCVCKSKTTARCMNHEKDLDYIPQLPLSVKTLVHFMEAGH